METATMNLLVDIGNSRVKWGTGIGKNIVTGKAFLHQNNIDHSLLLESWQNLEQPERLAIANVSSEFLSTQICSLARRLWPKIEILHPRAQANAYGVCNSYQNPEQLGVDRWLCLLALNRYFELPACVVNCGTAVTVDFINDQGMHLGGMIMPGLTLMKKSLHQATDCLQYYQQTFPIGLADNTGAAIYNGALLSVSGLVEYLIARQALQFKLILTGGDAELIAKHVSITTEIHTDLVLQGLSVILEN